MKTEFDKWLAEYGKSKEFTALAKGIATHDVLDGQDIFDFIQLLQAATAHYENTLPQDWQVATLKKVMSYWIPKEIVILPDALPIIALAWGNFFLFLDRKGYFADAQKTIIAIQEAVPLLMERSTEPSFWSKEKLKGMEEAIMAQDEQALSMLAELSDDLKGMSDMLDTLKSEAGANASGPREKQDRSMPASNVIPMTPSVKTNQKIYQVRIDIQHAKPPIWRRILIPAGTTFEGLHQIIQAAFQWNDTHLHYFESRGYRIEPQLNTQFHDSFDFKPAMNSANVDIDLFIEAEKKIFYEYDFGDSWEHIIKLEAILEPSTDIPFYPYCLKGKMHPPIDDVGGISGYKEFVQKVTKTPLSTEARELLEWYTGDDEPFKPAEFDRELVNEDLEGLGSF